MLRYTLCSVEEGGSTKEGYVVSNLITYLAGKDYGVGVIFDRMVGRNGRRVEGLSKGSYEIITDRSLDESIRAELARTNVWFAEELPLTPPTQIDYDRFNGVLLMLQATERGEPVSTVATTTKEELSRRLRGEGVSGEIVRLDWEFLYRLAKATDPFNLRIPITR